MSGAFDCGLDASTCQKIKRVFTQHPDIDRAILYGSRAKGTYKTGSDIDLSLEGINLTEQELYNIIRDLDDLELPYEIDLNIFDNIDSSSLIEHIELIGKTFFTRK